jgi:hypothetical protein
MMEIGTMDKRLLILLTAIAFVPMPVQAQRYNAAPRLIQLGFTINAQSIRAAELQCLKWGGTHLMPRPNTKNSWDCFRREKP